MIFSAPAGFTGYYRGSPGFMGTGTEQGSSTGVTQNMPSNVFTAGQGPGSGTGQWSPTILYLFVLIIAEMFIFGIIARHL